MVSHSGILQLVRCVLLGVFMLLLLACRGHLRQTSRLTFFGGEQGTTSLGTMVSFFVIWCVSLCASHIDSKDMPPPVLKLAAEEVASVLQSN